MVDTDKVHVTSITLQEWDDAQVDNVQGSRLPLRRFARRIRAGFNGALPPHRKYVGLSRSWLLCAIVTAIVVVLALTIGLTVGLKKGDSAKNLPLPTNGAVHQGDLTYYGVGLGACGITSLDSQAVVAISQKVFDAASTSSNPNANPLCGHRIRARRLNSVTGKTRSVDLTVVDRCVGCKPTDLDVSISAFEILAEVDQGRVDVQWAWL